MMHAWLDNQICEVLNLGIEQRTQSLGKERYSDPISSQEFEMTPSE